VDDTLQVEPNGMDAFGSEMPESVSTSDADPAVAVSAAPQAWSAAPVTGALAVLVLVEAFVIAALLVGRTNVFETRAGRLVIESDPAGADVWLDGKHLGMTPLSLMSDAGERSLRIEAHGSSQTMKIDVNNGQVTHARVDFVRVPSELSAAPIPSVIPALPPTPAPQVPVQEETPAPARSEAIERAVGPGWIDVPAVVALDVYEDGRHLGNTADGRLRLSSGPHALEFVNEELNVRVRVAALVHPGKVTSVTVRRPDPGERRTQTRVLADTPVPASVEFTQ
jgi:hypothetical protein